MNEDYVRVNSLKAWILAARPKTLTGAAVPVLVGTALALNNAGGAIRVLPAVLCFLFAFIMQIDANFVNDYFDFIRGNDDETRLGPKRACAQGWIAIGAMKKGLVLTTVLACIVGLPLVWYGGSEMILIGLLCVTFCFLYTTSLSYMGLGDLLVLLFFGIIPVSMTYFLAMPVGSQAITWQVLLASMACGFVIDALLLVNNYRDIDNDRKAGKMTFVVRVGKRNAEIAYLFVGITACMLGLVHLFYGNLMAFFLPFLYLIIHVYTWREMVKISQGKQLNAVLGKTASNMFVYGVLVSIGLLL